MHNHCNIMHNIALLINEKQKKKEIKNPINIFSQQKTQDHIQDINKRVV